MTSTTATQPLHDAASALRSFATKATQGSWEAGERCIWVADSDEAVVADAGGVTTPDTLADFQSDTDFVANRREDVEQTLKHVVASRLTSDSVRRVRASLGWDQ